MTETELLTRYAGRRDAEAFTQLVEQYQRLIFSTCRRRLHDAADLDDAVQETFLRMAKASGSVRSNVGAWLHRCATNVSTDLNRRRQTRTRHESQVVSQSPAGDPQRELAELREHLDAALEKLDADERELIIRRFFVGRSQVDLATEAGVAPSTISLRLNSAIDHLRDHLKTAGCVMVAAALVEGLEKEAASAAVPADLSAKIAKVGLTGVTAAGGAFAIWKFAAGFLLIAGIFGFGMWHLWRHDQPVAKPLAQAVPAVQVAPSPVAMTVDTGHGAVSDAPKWQPTAATPSRAPLSGQVTNRDGKPIAGAAVSLSGFTVKTDAQGQYAFDAKAVTNETEGRLTVTADGYQELGGIHDSSPKLTISPAAPTVRNIVLDRGVVITVQVRNSHGDPLDARVESYSSDVHYGQADWLTTDQDGMSRATVAPSKVPWVVVATMQGYAPAHDEVLCDSVDQPREVELILSPGVRVSGTAICGDGKPATGWGIEAKPSWSRSNYSGGVARIDADGKFTLEHIVVGQYQLSIARGPTYQSIGEYTLPPADNKPLLVNVPGNSPIGTFTLIGVVQCNKATNSSIMLMVRDTDAGSTYNEMVMVESNGYHNAAQTKKGLPFKVQDIPAGTYNLTVESPEFESTTVDNVKVPGKPVTIKVKILGNPHLHGTVVDPAGNPVTHFAVRVRQTEHLGHGPYYVQDADWIQVSDPQGRFDIELVCPGVYEAQASAPGYAWTWSPPARAEKLGVNVETALKLTAGGTLHGSVVDSANHPVVGAKAIPLSMASDTTELPHNFAGEAGAVITDAQGQFTILHLAPGNESIKLTNPDFAPLIVSDIKINDGQENITAPVVLHLGGSAEGTVYDASGNVAAGMTIDFQDDDRYHYQRGELARHLLGSAVSDEAGHYRVDHLPIRKICVMKSYADNGERNGVIRRTLLPIDGQTVRLDFGGTIPVRGRLLVADKPSPHTALTFSIGDPNFGSTILSASTDADGKFAFFGPPPGDYTLSVEDANGFNRQLLLGDFSVTDPPHDIGDVIRDTGQVVIRLSQADAANAQYIEIERPDVADWWKRSIGSATADGKDPTTWIENDVPAGRFVASIQMKAANRKHRFPLERRPGADVTTLTVPVRPQATALLVASASSDAVKQAHMGILRSDDGTNEVTLIGTWPAKQVVVPPGRYHFIDRVTEKPMPGLPAVEAKSGETTTVDLSAQPLIPLR